MTEEQKLIADLFEICNSTIDIAKEYMGKDNRELNRLNILADKLLKNPVAIQAIVASVWAKPDPTEN
jgi:hypothetical protein